MSKGIAKQIKNEASKNEKEFTEYLPWIIWGDARKLPFMDYFIDLVCCQPPYADAINYTWNVNGDLSKIHDVTEFLQYWRSCERAISCFEKWKKVCSYDRRH